MASLGLSLSNARSLYPHLNLGFPSKPRILPISTLNFSPTSLSTFRSLSSRRLQVNQKILTVSATSSDSGGGKASNEGSDEKKTSNTGPPLLTILFGFLVFFLVFRVVGSFVMWLISLLFNVFPPK